MKKYFLFCSFLCLFACQKEEILFSEQVKLDFWLDHKGAQMPITIDGNSNSKVFVLLVHGGAGGSAQVYNELLSVFSNPLEQKYAMVYWDQRQSGMTRGEHSATTQTVEQFVEDTDKVVDFLKFKFGSDIKIFLAGHSWGGFLTMAYSAAHQDKIQGQMILNGTSSDAQTWQQSNIKQIKEIAKQQIAAQQTPNQWQTILTDITKIDSTGKADDNLVFTYVSKAEILIAKQLVKRTFKGSQSSGWDIYKEKFHPFIMAIAEAALAMRDVQYTYQLNEKQKVVKIPTSFIVSDYDVRVSKYVANFSYNQIATPTAKKEIITIKNAEHSMMVTHPLETAEAMIQFVEKNR
jgi:proline iminopeptidase